MDILRRSFLQILASIPAIPLLPKTQKFVTKKMLVTVTANSLIAKGTLLYFDKIALGSHWLAPSRMYVMTEKRGKPIGVCPKDMGPSRDVWINVACWRLRDNEEFMDLIP